MEISPFPHQGPLEPSQVSGRDDLLADLTERVTERRVTALLGPRRFGKTSVLRRVAADLAAAGTSVIWVDLYEVTSTAELARRFDAALAEADGPVRWTLGEVAARVNLNLGFVGLELTRRRDERPDPDGLLDALLDTLVAGASATATVVVIDEFPGIDRVPGATGLLRTKLQHHYQEIGLLFAGSQPSLMRTMFADRERPFYAQADLVEIGPLSRQDLAAFVEDGFRWTDRDPGDLGAHIHTFTGGHPYRSMQAADASWRLAEPGGGPVEWGAVLERLRSRTAMSCDAIFAGMTGGEKATLRLLAHGDALFGTVAELHDLSSGSARHARDTLVAAGDVIEVDGRYRIVDPVFADWIRQRFPR